MMSRIRSSVVNVLLRALDPIERDVVEGDFNEMHLPRARAVRELSGLLVRQQLAAGLDWRPWATVVFVALPLGMVRTRYARRSAVWLVVLVGRWSDHYWLFKSAGKLDILAIAVCDDVAGDVRLFQRQLAIVAAADTIVLKRPL
jgi:hypothetical protein